MLKISHQGLFFSILLERGGAKVSTAENGQVAISMLLELEPERYPYDFVIMDTQMPVMNGWDAIKHLRAEGFEKPIISLSAGATEADREKCLAAGANAVALKPIDRTKLFEEIARQLASR